MSIKKKAASEDELVTLFGPRGSKVKVAADKAAKLRGLGYTSEKSAK